jgi:hypothetical protein
LNGTSLTVKKATGPTLTLTNFKLAVTTNNNTTAYSEYGSGRVNDSALNGYVNFKTPTTTPFTGIGDQYPSSGSMTVTGANNSSIKLTTNKEPRRKQRGIADVIGLISQQAAGN